ncbi:Uncharacterised protein [Mesomycoplasma dispar]|uniref:Lipoprotein n=1 Tax=Mesomycoplasma dispar TaxID=86660 RepID=A0AAJ5NQ98_9BACT|nr:hypothetical protein [Mesomycoplasma dispar]AJR12259.1 hypothetical protein MDIS_02425 [Mesomycoplasma dispar]VEU61925.1 Uncharacterised protein [Mesomycoplasma dispar]
MKKFFKNSLILSSISLPLLFISCIEKEKEDLNKRVFSNSEATEKYQLLKEILNMPLAIEQNDIASYNFSTLINEFGKTPADANKPKKPNEPNFQRFLQNEPKDVILKKISAIAKDPKFPEIVKKFYTGTSYLSASEFFEKWKESQKKYLESTDLKATPDFVPLRYGSGFSIKNPELDQNYLFYKTINAFAKFFIKNSANEPEYPPRIPIPPSFPPAMPPVPAPPPTDSESKTPPNTEKPPKTSDSQKNDGKDKGQIKPVLQKQETKTKYRRPIPVPIPAIQFIVNGILSATTQPVPNAYWWNYNYKILNLIASRIESQTGKELDWDLPILGDKNFKKKLELTQKLEKYTIIGKDGRKYKVQPRPFFLIDDKTFVDKSTNKIKNVLYRLYWIIDQNTDSNSEDGKKDEQNRNSAQSQQGNSEKKQQNVEKDKKTSEKSPVNQKFESMAQLFASSKQLKNINNQQNENQQNQSEPPKPEEPKVQGPQPKPDDNEEQEEQIGFVDDISKYKFTDKIQKWPFDNSNNFSRGGLYSASLLELEAEMKKQDPNNPNLFYVERHIDINGFLTKGKLLPYQPIDLENNLESLSLYDKYNQFIQAGQIQQQFLIINPENLE